MVNEASQRDMDFLSDMLNGMEREHPGITIWDESPFRWVLAQPSATKGAIARQLISSWALLHGMRLERVTIDHQIYLKLGGYFIQVKFSTLWDSGYYRFQQVRDRQYDFCLCFGLAPMDMNAWLVPKSVLDIHVIGTKGQHTGVGSGETWWFETRPISTDRWLRECGGQLADVSAMLKSLA